MPSILTNGDLPPSATGNTTFDALCRGLLFEDDEYDDAELFESDGIDNSLLLVFVEDGNDNEELTPAASSPLYLKS